MSVPGHPLDSQVITTDRPCPGCNYNLKGLRKGGKCPECGRPIGGKASGRFADNITHASPRYLRTLRAGLLLMCAAIPVFCVPLLSPALWAAGVWVAMTRRPTDEHTTPDAILDTPRLRTANRWLAMAPLGGSVVYTLANLLGAGWLRTGLEIVAAAVSIVGAAAFVPLSVYLSALADWASYESVAGRFRATAWGIAVFGSLAAVLGVIPPTRFFAFVATIVVVIAFLFLMLSVVQLTNVVHWAIRNQDFAEGSTARILEKKAKRAGQPGVVHDMRCLHCRHDLEGLPFGGVCPECGTSFADVTPLPIRPLPVRRPEDEAPIPVDDPGGAGQQPGDRAAFRYSRPLGEPERPPAPNSSMPFDEADLDIGLEPDDR